MQTPFPFILLAVLAAACSTTTPGTDAPADTDVEVVDTDLGDADTDVVTGACDPLASAGAQGCDVGEKCAWVILQDTPDLIGALTCVPDGTVAVGGACASGAAGESTGYDNCVAGGACVGGICLDVCGFDGSANAACGASNVCSRYGGLFGNGSDEPIAGACTPTCNPLTQTLGADGTCGEGKGCYVLTSSTESVAVCGLVGSGVHGEEITGAPFANACAPGHRPRLPYQGATTWECGALCLPADVTASTNVTEEGGVSPYTCESKGAAAPGDATNGESCRYYWGVEPFDGVSSVSNTLGFCFKHAVFQYDSNGDQAPDADFPRCTTLTRGDVVPPIANPPGDDALEFWCVAKPVSALRAARPSPVGRMGVSPWADRLGSWR